MKSDGVCLWGIFQSGGSEDVVQLWKTGGVSPGGVMKHHVLQEELGPGGWQH